MQTRTLQFEADGSPPASLTYHFAASAYPTEFAAAAAFERVQRKLRNGSNDVGVMRVRNPGPHDPMPGPFAVLVIGTDEGVVRRGERLLRDGVLYAQLEGSLQALAMRRVRIGLDAVAKARARGRAPGFTAHRLTTPGGTEVYRDGSVRPHLRGQG